jgi:hypothetical protein
MSTSVKKLQGALSFLEEALGANAVGAMKP